jgi:hypothetical protein
MAAATGVLFCGLWLVGFPRLQRDGIIQSATIFEMIKISLAAIAGVGGVVALVVAYRRQRVLEAGNVRSEREELRSHTRLQEERFARASEEIGSEKAAVQLAGIYAMAALADDWPSGRERCVEVLCAFLRLPPKVVSEPTEQRVVQLGADRRIRRSRQVIDPRSTREAREGREVRATILRLIARHLRHESEVSWAGIDLDFTGALIEDADFSGCQFLDSEIRFKESTFSSGIIRFDRATFDGARMIFSGAAFEHSTVYFNGAEILGGLISFGASKFNHGRVVMKSCSLSGGRLSFGEARMSASGITFTDCVFGGDAEVLLGHTYFHGGSVLFQRSVFDGREVDLKNSQLQDGEIAFRDCRFSGDSGFRLAGSTVGKRGKITLSRILFDGRAASFAKTKLVGGTINISGATFSRGKLSFGVLGCTREL